MSPGFPHSLFEAFAEVLNAELTFDETRSGPAAGEDPFRSGDADIGWVCSTSFVDLSMRGESPSVQLVGVAWVPDDPDGKGRPVYFGDVVTRGDSPVGSFADLRGRTVGCNDEVSLSGFYSLSFALEDKGLPDDFVDRALTGGHHRSLDRLLEGEIDCAVIDSVVRKTRARIDPGVANLSVVERLGPWPVQPLVARATLPPAEVDSIKVKLFEAAEQPKIQAELHAAGLKGLVEVGDDHYQPVREAMARLQKPS